VLATIGFVVALVVAVSIWVFAAAALHPRQQRNAHIEPSSSTWQTSPSRTRRPRGEVIPARPHRPGPPPRAARRPARTSASHYGQQRTGPRQPRGQDGL